MKEIVERYEGSETAEGRPPDSAMAKFFRDMPEEYMLVPGILLGLAITFVTVFGTRRILGRLLPDIGSGEGEFGEDFSAELGVKDGRAAGVPVKYNWVPAAQGKHPAVLNMEFTVENPRGVRLHLHKEGLLNLPLGSLAAKVQAPPRIEALGYVLRLEPPGLLAELGARLEAELEPLCAAGLYEARLEGRGFSAQVSRRETIELEESRLLMQRAAAAAALFR